MDLLKTMMVYMGLTYAMAMQAAPTPSPAELAALNAQPTAAIETAAPTESPVNHATVAGLPAPTLAPEATETPAPNTAVQTAAAAADAAPTISPNPSYRLLNRKTRGKAVQKLQEKLIELGYLNDTADGVYGPKTAKAVRLFQKVNGLTQDGAAGKRTQTVLYEDPNVKPNPKAKNITTAAPAIPVAETTADVIEIPAATEAPAAALTEVKDAKVLLNQNAAALMTIRRNDGVAIGANLPVLTNADGKRYLSLPELANAASTWTLTEQVTGTITLQAEGHSITARPTGSSWTAQVDGGADQNADIVRQADGSLAIGADWLCTALGGSADWQEETKTLTLVIPALGLSSPAA